MDAQVATHEHAHPGPALYLRVAVILFVMTALEVLAFEVSHRPGMPLHAEIIVGSRRLYTYFTYPLQQTAARALREGDVGPN